MKCSFLTGVIDIRAMRTIANFQAHEKTVKSICIANDQLVSGSIEGDIKVDCIYDLFFKIWSLSDLMKCDIEKRIVPSHRLARSAQSIQREGHSSVMQIRFYDEHVYALDTGALRRFRI